VNDSDQTNKLIEKLTPFKQQAIELLKFDYVCQTFLKQKPNSVEGKISKGI
jgi:hypothetical protein